MCSAADAASGVDLTLDLAPGQLVAGNNTVQINLGRAYVPNATGTMMYCRPANIYVIGPATT